MICQYRALDAYGALVACTHDNDESRVIEIHDPHDRIAPDGSRTYIWRCTYHHAAALARAKDAYDGDPVVTVTVKAAEQIRQGES